jgi:hypothetical protein
VFGAWLGVGGSTRDESVAQPRFIGQWTEAAHGRVETTRERVVATRLGAGLDVAPVDPDRRRAEEASSISLSLA